MHVACVYYVSSSFITTHISILLCSLPCGAKHKMKSHRDKFGVSGGDWGDMLNKLGYWKGYKRII